MTTVPPKFSGIQATLYQQFQIGLQTTLHQFKFTKDKLLNDFSDNLKDKLQMLNIAHLVGLKIPNTLLTGSKKLLLKYLKGTLITKPIYSNNINFSIDNNLFFHYL